MNVGTAIRFSINGNSMTGSVLVAAGPWLVVRADPGPYQDKPSQHPFVVPTEDAEAI